MDDATKAPESIVLIEELAANAWPAELVDELDGWRLRFNWGVTSRAGLTTLYPYHYREEPVG
ncbi:MAG: hypothetical protein IIC20_04195 [Chloroflexi bacterium]|nr:hypothetical protein [Chloroflexota bacterium]